MVEDPDLTCSGDYGTNVPENSTGVSRGYIAYCRVEDPEHEDFDMETDGSWALSGDDGSLFVIEWLPSDRDWELKFRTAPDFENPQDANTDNVYKVTITFTSETGNRTASESYTITVTDIFEMTGPAAVTYVPITSRQVATYSAVGQDGAAVNNWSLPAGADLERFSISNAGVLSFKAQPSRLTAGDADRNFAYQVTVRGTDSSNRRTDLPVTVKINQPPFVHEGVYTLSVFENQTTAAGTFSVRDAEGDAISWSVGGTDGAHFRWSGAYHAFGSTFANDLSFKRVPEYELAANDPNWDADKNRVYALNIIVSDQYGPRSYPVTVTVKNVDEAPTLSGRSSIHKGGGIEPGGGHLHRGRPGGAHHPVELEREPTPTTSTSAPAAP